MSRSTYLSGSVTGWTRASAAAACPCSSAGSPTPTMSTTPTGQGPITCSAVSRQTADWRIGAHTDPAMSCRSGGCRTLRSRASPSWRHLPVTWRVSAGRQSGPTLRGGTWSRRQQKDLSDVGRRLHDAVRLSSFGHGQPLVDHRSDEAARDHRPDVLLDGGDDGGLLLGRAGAQRGGGDAGPFREELADVELGGAAALQSDHDEAAAGGEGLDVPGQVRRPHDVEDDVRTDPVGGRVHRGDEVFGAVV